MQMKSGYMCFYLEGRTDEEEDPQLADDEGLDIDKLAEKALAGGAELREVLVAAVTALAAPLEHGKSKRNWIDDHKAEIKDAGGDSEDAYRHYCKGTIDEAVYQLESDVLEAMGDEEADDEDDEDEED